MATLIADTATLVDGLDQHERLEPHVPRQQRRRHDTQTPTAKARPAIGTTRPASSLRELASQGDARVSDTPPTTPKSRLIVKTVAA